MPDDTTDKTQDEMFEDLGGDPTREPTEEEARLAKYFAEPGDETEEAKTEETKTEEAKTEEGKTEETKTEEAKTEEDKTGEGDKKTEEAPGEPQDDSVPRGRRGRTSARLRAAERRAQELEQQLYEEKQFRQGAEERADALRKAAKGDPADFQSRVEDGEFDPKKPDETQNKDTEADRPRYEPNRSEMLFLEELGAENPDAIPASFVKGAPKAWPEVLHVLPRLQHPEVVLAYLADLTEENPGRLQAYRAMSADDLRDDLVRLEHGSMARAEALADVKRLKAEQDRQLKTNASPPASRPQSGGGGETGAKQDNEEKESFWI